MSAWDDLRDLAVAFEAGAEKRGAWDEPSMLFGVQRADDGNYDVTLAPLQGLDGHAYYALRMFAEIVKSGVVPSEGWDSSRMVGLILVNETWQRNRDTDPAFAKWVEDKGASVDDSESFDKLRVEYYGTLKLADIPGSTEHRNVLIVMGKRADMLDRQRGSDTVEWFSERAKSHDAEDWQLSGPVVEAMRAILAATRGT